MANATLHVDIRQKRVYTASVTLCDGAWTENLNAKAIPIASYTLREWQTNKILQKKYDQLLKWRAMLAPGTTWTNPDGTVGPRDPNYVVYVPDTSVPSVPASEVTLSVSYRRPVVDISFPFAISWSGPDFSPHGEGAEWIVGVPRQPSIYNWFLFEGNLSEGKVLVSGYVTLYYTAQNYPPATPAVENVVCATKVS
jgi:hypothetical protein